PRLARSAVLREVRSGAECASAQGRTEYAAGPGPVRWTRVPGPSAGGRTCQRHLPGPVRRSLAVRRDHRGRLAGAARSARLLPSDAGRLPACAAGPRWVARHAPAVRQPAGRDELAAVLDLAALHPATDRTLRHAGPGR